MSCDGSGHAIGCPGCTLCDPRSGSQQPPAPPLSEYALATWERVERERAAFERRYADAVPAY